MIFTVRWLLVVNSILWITAGAWGAESPWEPDANRPTVNYPRLDRGTEAWVLVPLLCPEIPEDLLLGLGAEINLMQEAQTDAGKYQSKMGAAVAKFRKGSQYWHHDRPQAVRLIRQAAAAGLPPAQMVMGLTYQHGFVGAPDAAEGMRWLQLAAEQDYAPAQLLMASALTDAKVKPEGMRETPEMLVWCQKSAAQGYAPAQYVMGLTCYYYMDVQAHHWFQLAAAQGLGKAKEFLRRMYLEGEGAELGASEDRAKALLNRANLYRLDGKTQLALADFEQVIGLAGAGNPQLALALAYRGAYLNGRQEFAVAIPDLTHAAELSGVPTSTRAMVLINRAIAYERLNEPTKAVADYSRVLQLPRLGNTDSIAALQYRGTIYLRYQPQNPALAAADFEHIINHPRVTPAQTVEALIGRGVARAMQNEHAPALADFQQALDTAGITEQQRAIVWQNRAGVYLMQRDSIRMSLDLKRVLASTEALPETRQRAEKLLAALPEELRLPPAELVERARKSGSPQELARALLLRGHQYRLNNDLAGAQADFDELIKLGGADDNVMADALINRGVIRNNRRELSAAIDDYTRALQIPKLPDSTRAIILINRGHVYHAQGNYSQTMTDFEQALAIPGLPSNQQAVILAKRGALYGDQRYAGHDFAKSMAEFTAAAGLPGLTDADWALILSCRATVYYLKGEPAQAEQDARRILALANIPPANRTQAEQIIKLVTSNTSPATAPPAN
ncbi:MAG: hypothetical protein LBK76_00365 [Verrucomicrobiales bacterium]|jgi:tetratricopeptide (TPR) repeat protein|nr:hypothetical protein [Verrucomicrobiales bacterium]